MYTRIRKPDMTRCIRLVTNGVPKDGKPENVNVPKRFDTQNWRHKAKPIPLGSTYPAKENCSKCGLCDTYFVSHVKEACAFLGPSTVVDLETRVHGRPRDMENDDELLFGVIEETFNARSAPPVPGAQWTGVVTRIAMSMLEGDQVDAVVCVQSQDDDRLAPKPFVATSTHDILAAKGVKPCLSPNLEVLATVEALNVRRLLFIGVGCQVHALRHIEPFLDVDELYVLGLNCTDNGERAGLEKFLHAASKEPDTVQHYEFMQDYRVHLKHLDGSYERVPYFCLPAQELSDVIAPSCLSCFLYPNDLADLVVGYMKTPYDPKTPMDKHFQSVLVRNARGKAMLDNLEKNGDTSLERVPPVRGGFLGRESLVLQTVIADDEAKLGRGPEKGAPTWLGEILATLLTMFGPQGIDFAKYSIEYHYIRNFIHVMRHWESSSKSEEHIPEYVRKIVQKYDEKSNGGIRRRTQLKAPFPGLKTNNKM